MPALTTRQIRTLTEPGVYSAGGNLYLQVRGSERRSWLFRYMLNGRARSMGLGPADEVSLTEARALAETARKLLRAGVDPLTEREATRTAAIAAKARAVTFDAVADRYLAAHQSSWRSKRHAAIWRASIAQYTAPLIGALPVAAIDTDLVLRVLEPIWQTKTVTATRLRGRIESILSYATARGWRDGPNPAVWRGHLQLLLSAPAKLRPVAHFAALDWRDAPAFMADLRAHDSAAARALEFAILTAARSGEVREATWSEIDLISAVWSLPSARMKGRRPHRVPLPQPALAVLHAMSERRTERSLVFPGWKAGRPMTDETLARVLAQLKRGELTVHGFRSTFRDWAAEATSYPNHVVEQALAHAIGNQVEAAYRRGDLFTKRVALMDDWSEYLARPPAEVMSLRSSRSANGAAS